ncbi:winged helix-turn-helix domain-containing protein [Psychroserpens sp.]|uniref:winged helix-turn-helix domain-containing protein n=1 Tax=Psychroserpens sp. TaxID=2020870 RepID=UPI001B229BCE|nr:winged helix-turn-helix domain-containing protein [Psychroserpens sp.]MBO6606389.1 winged helix-turn-helix transcriptional regulator [Psychroserpens sp.]MBO6632172.1 winged helix-turn-helix transcriptional regulator [Psychroserpens sp.]MBO6653093.1 winged helix-turn-helix transcriptional regulator [Psychroserpens sp.]MBO6680879.1 winged helix-turn-helix transcriptional regulator [Psychroserpens sp.]MBO6750163.1 winged helix-turn-helix transcriptional regulator [Psychroserpens sp.]
MRKIQIYLLVIVILALILSFVFTDSEKKQSELKSTSKIALREVGNQLLLNNDDETSLVMPVKEVDNHLYQLSFESQLSIVPDSLITTIKERLNAYAINNDYRVEVFQCNDNEVAYSYQIVNDSEDTIVACLDRELPRSCYTIQLQLLDEQQSLSRGQLLVLCLIVGLLLFVIEFIVYRRTVVSASVANNLDYERLGSFRFYPDQNKLVKEAEEISLSKKECELLSIFIMRPNEIIKRDELTKRVWEDNGVIVGRSLDTYISKLRKKLKDDTNIKFTNVHGVGYKLEVKTV